MTNKIRRREDSYMPKFKVCVSSSRILFWHYIVRRQFLKMTMLGFMQRREASHDDKDHYKLHTRLLQCQAQGFRMAQDDVNEVLSFYDAMQQIGSGSFLLPLFLQSSLISPHIPSSSSMPLALHVGINMALPHLIPTKDQNLEQNSKYCILDNLTFLYLLQLRFMLMNLLFLNYCDVIYLFY